MNGTRYMLAIGLGLAISAVILLTIMFIVKG